MDELVVLVGVVFSPRGGAGANDPNLVLVAFDVNDDEESGA